MKKFFKALALLLALTLVIGTIPVSAATSEFSFAGDKDGKKILYIGGSNGEDKDGNKCKTKNFVDLTKRIDGFDADTMDIVLSAKNKDIVKTVNKSDRIYAKAIGSTTVTATIYYKDDVNHENDLGSVKIKVQVKKNAEAVPYSVYTLVDGAPVPVDLSTKLGVNTDYYVLVSRHVDGVKVDTDHRRLLCEDAENVKIEIANPKVNTIFKVNFAKAGEYTLQAVAYQSEKFNKVLLSEDIKVKVGYEAKAVAQKSLDEATVSFATKVSGLKPENFSAYYMTNGENPTRVEFSYASHVNCEDEKAYVQFYSPFVQGTEYFIEYDGTTVGSFKAVTVTADSVKSIVIPEGQSFGKNDKGKLNYMFLDENGVDITKASVLYAGGIPVFDLVKADDDFNSSITYNGPKDADVVLDKEGEYGVKITYQWFDNNSVQQTVVGEGKITCVKIGWARGNVTGVVRKDLKQNYIKNETTLNGDAKTQKWAMEDNADINGGKTIAYLQIAVPYTKNGKTIYEGLGVIRETSNVNGVEIPGPGEFYKYVLQSANEEIVMLDTDVQDANGNIYATLIGNKAGTTNIIVKGVSVVNYNDVETVIGIIPVEVLAKRQPTNFMVDAKGNMINYAYANDGIGFDIIMLDQYDEEMIGLDVKITQIGADTSSNKYFGPVFGDIYEFALTGKGNPWNPDWTLKPDMLWLKNDAKHDGTGALRLQFECAGKKYSTPAINVGNDGKRTKNVLNVSGTSLDTAVDRWNNMNDITVSLNGKNKNGFAVTGSSIWFEDATPQELKAMFENWIKANPDADWAGYYPEGSGYNFYNVYKDGKLVTFKDMANNYKGYSSNLLSNFGYNEYWLDTNKFSSISTNVISRAAIDVDSEYDTYRTATTGAISKLDNGSYRIAAFEISVDSKNNVKITSIGNATFTVTDSQAGLEVTKNDNAEKLSSLDADSIASAFTVKFKGDVVTTIGNSTLNFNFTTDANGNAYVKSVTANIDIADKGTLVLSANIDTVVRLAK